MPNALTGDLEAFLQVSGKTIRRLLASMHQNGGGPTGLPTFPHSAFFRIGDGAAEVDGVRGSVRAQIAVPAVQFASGVRDRFTVRTWIRARYLADTATSPLPEFIHGELRADYLVDEIRDTQRGGDLLTAKLDPESVLFTSAGPDTSADAEITEQAVLLLQTRFQMRPHPLGDEFRLKRLRPLVAPDGTQAVVIALPLNHPEPTGDPAGVNSVILGGKDFAVAVSREAILAVVQAMLNAMQAVRPHFTITLKFLWFKVDSAEYEASLATATAGWALGTGTLGPATVPAAWVTLHLEGHAVTDSVEFPNVSFTIDDHIAVVFDPSSETLLLQQTNDPSVDISAGAIGVVAGNRIRQGVKDVYNAQLAAALASAAPKLQLTAAKSKLVAQLKSLDDQANAHLDAAEYRNEGLILRGTISLAGRHLGVVKAEQTADPGYTALQSWLPGGRVDRYEWQWFWFNPASGPYGPPSPYVHVEDHDDRFVLEESAAPLPGLAPSPFGGPAAGPAMAGALCLTFRGIQVHSVTGDDVPVDTKSTYLRLPPCRYFYPAPPIVGGDSRRLRALSRIWADDLELAEPAQREIAVIDAQRRPSESPFNTLIQRVDAASLSPALTALAAALRAAARPDAGLLVVLLFGDGALTAGGPQLPREMQQFAKAVGRLVVTTEDVRQGWSTALELPSGRGRETSWLVDARGEIAWRHEGAISAAALAAALRDRLISSPPPRPVCLTPTLGAGDRIPELAITLPPEQRVRLADLQGQPLLLCFVLAWAPSSLAWLKRLGRLEERIDNRGASALVVADHATDDDVRRLKREMGPSFTILADPEGALADAFGVRIWPTTFMIDERGRVESAGTGADRGALRAMAREQAVRAKSQIPALGTDAGTCDADVYPSRIEDSRTSLQEG
jgi:peroxiredoxin